MENIKLQELMEARIVELSKDELFDELKNGLINQDWSEDELRDYFDENDVDTDVDIEEVIAEAEYIRDLMEAHKDNKEEYDLEEIGSSHYHEGE